MAMPRLWMAKRRLLNLITDYGSLCEMDAPLILRFCSKLHFEVGGYETVIRGFGGVWRFSTYARLRGYKTEHRPNEFWLRLVIDREARPSGRPERFEKDLNRHEWVCSLRIESAISVPKKIPEHRRGVFGFVWSFSNCDR